MPILTGQEEWGRPIDRNWPYPRRAAIPADDFDWEVDRLLDLPAENLIIYELHVRGFTLADLVSYHLKHNLDHGEVNRDGANDNESWNFGAEGLTEDADILVLRRRQICYGGIEAEDIVYVAFNSFWESLRFELPDPHSKRRWHVAINTGMPVPQDAWDIG